MRRKPLFLWAFRITTWLVAGHLAACGDPASGPGIEFDPCGPLVLLPDREASPQEQAAIQAGSSLWNQAAHARLTIAAAGSPTAVDGNSAADGPTPQVRIHFQAAAAPFHGYYDPGTGAVFVNADLANQPGPAAIAIAHELGHAFGLVHVQDRPSVMAPGNLDVAPTPRDVGVLVQHWGVCPAAADQSAATTVPR